MLSKRLGAKSSGGTETFLHIVANNCKNKTNSVLNWLYYLFSKLVTGQDNTGKDSESKGLWSGFWGRAGTSGLLACCPIIRSTSKSATESSSECWWYDLRNYLDFLGWHLPHTVHSTHAGTLFIWLLSIFRLEKEMETIFHVCSAVPSRPVQFVWLIGQRIRALVVDQAVLTFPPPGTCFILSLEPKREVTWLKSTFLETIWTYMDTA